MIKKNIVFIGSSTFEDDVIPKLEKLINKILGCLDSKKFSIVTGSGGGLAEYLSIIGSKKGFNTIGISPHSSMEEHKDLEEEDVEVYTNIIFTGLGYKGRNVILIRSADIIISIGGGCGTLNELTTAFDEGKIICLMSDTKFIGVATDLFSKINKSLPLKTKKTRIYSITSDIDLLKVMEENFNE